LLVLSWTLQVQNPQLWSVLGSSSGEDGSSVRWKLIAVGDCLKTNELKMIKQLF
jgi:hypothetical protein